MNAQITKSTAVITGASSGIGAVYADTTENVYWVLQFAINPGQSEDLQTLMAAMPGLSPVYMAPFVGFRR